jgi:hypothetical protein
MGYQPELGSLAVHVSVFAVEFSSYSSTDSSILRGKMRIVFSTIICPLEESQGARIAIKEKKKYIKTLIGSPVSGWPRKIVKHYFRMETLDSTITHSNRKSYKGANKRITNC